MAAIADAMTDTMDAIVDVIEHAIAAIIGM